MLAWQTQNYGPGKLLKPKQLKNWCCTKLHITCAREVGSNPFCYLYKKIIFNRRISFIYFMNATFFFGLFEFTIPSFDVILRGCVDPGYLVSSFRCILLAHRYPSADIVAIVCVVPQFYSWSVRTCWSALLASWSVLTFNTSKLSKHTGLVKQPGAHTFHLVGSLINEWEINESALRLKGLLCAQTATCKTHVGWPHWAMANHLPLCLAKWFH